MAFSTGSIRTPASTIHRRDVGISNTLAWSPDRRRFYFGDSLANTIWSYDYDRATGTIQNEAVFFAGFDRGLPDGSTVDAEGYLWNCRYDGGCIVRVSPDGKIDRVIEMPVKNITTCTFGGADLKTLFVTTASATLPPASAWLADCLRFNARLAGRQKTGFACLAARRGPSQDLSQARGAATSADVPAKVFVVCLDLAARCLASNAAAGMSPGISSPSRTRRTCCLPVRPDNIRRRQRFRPRRKCPSSRRRLLQTTPCSPCPRRAPSPCNEWI